MIPCLDQKMKKAFYSNNALHYFDIVFKKNSVWFKILLIDNLLLFPSSKPHSNVFYKNLV